MQLVEAYEVLGVGSNASQEEATQAYVRQRASFESGLIRASSESVKAKYQKQLDELEEARKVLLPNYSPTPVPGDSITDAPIRGIGGTQAGNATPPGLFDTPLTATQFADLPTPSPHLAGGLNFTAGGAHGSTVAPGMGGQDGAYQGADGDGGAAAAAAAGISIRPGQVLLNRYDVKQVLGVGGMGAVYGAYDRVLGMDVALKVLLPALARNAGARERFLHEAKISISLTHPNIANVKEVQQEGDLCFLTMELLKGRTLRHEMEAKATVKMPFSPKEVIELCKPVCDALNYAHQFTVHRDIKPENIWLCKDGSVKIMDFGIAQLLSPTRMTQTAMAMGTAFYMAPEQMQSAKQVDKRADQYSLAVVLYELLAGKLPTGRAKALAEIRHDIPAPLSSAVDKALSTNPEDRFADMDEFYKAVSKKGRTAHGTKKLLIGAAVLAAIAAAVFVATNPKARMAVVERFEAPSAPLDLVATENGGTAVKLQWKDASPGLTKGYKITRTDPKGKAEELESKSTSFTDLGLTEDTEYKYEVVAVGKAGPSGASRSASAKTLPKPPTAGSIPKATAVATDPEHAVQLSLASGDTGAGIAKVLQRSSDNLKWEPLPATAEDFQAGKYTDTKLEPDTQYFYRVLIKNPGGESIGQSLTYYTSPPAPDGFQAKAVDGKIQVSWASDLKESRDLVLIRNKQPITLSDDEKKSKTWTFPDPEFGTSYDFSLAVKNPDGIVGKSAVAAVTMPSVPPRPMKVVKSGADAIQLQWEKEKNIKSYKILRKEDEGAFQDLHEVAGTEKDYTDKSITRGKTYAYRLVAVNAGGPSEPSDPTDPVVARLPEPELPTISAKPKDNKKEVLVNWKFSKLDTLPGLDKIVLERSTSLDGEYTAIQTFSPPFAGNGAFTDTQGLLDGHEYFYQMRLFAHDYPNPFLASFLQPVIPKLQAVVVPGAAAGNATSGAAAVKATPMIVFGVPQPTPGIFRPDNPDAILKGLSTPTPTPEHK